MTKKLTAFLLTTFLSLSAIACSEAILLSGAPSGASTCWTVVNGWTDLCATAGTGTCNALGTGTQTGTCYTTVSSSTGNDGTCTSATTQAAAEAAPCLTIAKGVSLTRGNKPDWLLLKKGDTWTAEGFGNGMPTGASASAPVLISSYGTGARPILRSNDSSGNILFYGGAAGSLAVVGLEFYNYVADPANAGYDGNAGGRNAISFLAGATFLLFEDTKFSFYRFAFDMQGSTYTDVRIRRNVIVDQYSNNNPIFGNSSGFLLSGYTDVLVEENLFDRNGWNATLITPASVTVTQATPAVVTWTSNKLPTIPTAGNRITFASSDGGILSGTSYYVFSNNGTTFKIIPGISSSGVKTNGSPVITGIASTAGMAAGATERLVTGVGIPFNTTIVSVDSGTQITLSKNATASETSAFSVNPFFAVNNTTGTVTNGSPIITGIDTTAMQVGAGIVAVFGGIPAATTIISIDSATQLTMSANATTSQGGFYVSVTPIAPAVFLNTTGGTGNNTATWSGAVQTAFNHNFYIGTFTDPPIILRKNIIANDSCAAQQRSGGTQDDNLQIGNPIAANFGMPEAQTGVISNNVYTEGIQGLADCGGAGGPALIATYNSHPFDVGTMTYYNNLVFKANPQSAGDWGLQISGSGVNSAINNVICSWGGTPIEDLGSGTVLSGNKYKVSACTTSGWTGGEPTLTDPTVTVGTYNAQISGCGALPAGCTATTAAFLTNARSQSKEAGWNAALAAPAANVYFRAGIGMSAYVP